MKDKVIEKIISFVNSREDIRAAILNGSRVNPNAPKDDFQDYDIRLFVKDNNVYKNDLTWINNFGNILYKQINPSVGEKLILGENTVGLICMVLYKEGFRIDFSFSLINEYIIYDSLSIVLVDKDHAIPKLPEPNDSFYWVKKPTIEEYNYVVNEFFWCLTNIAKGLLREELPYVKLMYEDVVRHVHLLMIKWYIGLKYNWKVNVGKFGKWFKYYLSIDLYKLLEESYSGNDYNSIWDSLFAAIKLFKITAQELANKLHFKYPIEDTNNVINYLKDLRLKYLNR